MIIQIDTNTLRDVIYDVIGDIDPCRLKDWRELQRTPLDELESRSNVQEARVAGWLQDLDDLVLRSLLNHNHQA